MVLLNRIRLPGFRGAGLVDVLLFFIRSIQDVNFTLRAMAMAYRFFFSLFPALIILFTLLPYIPIDNLEAQVRAVLESQLPSSGIGLVDQILNEAFAGPSPGLISLNVALLFFSAMGATRVMMRAFSINSGLEYRRTFLQESVMAFLILLYLAFLFLVTLAFAVASEFLFNTLQANGVISGGIVYWLLESLDLFLIFMAFQFGIAVLYFLGPAHPVKWRFFTPGSILSSLLTLVFGFVFRYFLTHFSNYNKLYGSLSAVMILMLWFYLLSIVILVGFELNHAIDQAQARQGARGWRKQFRGKPKGQKGLTGMHLREKVNVNVKMKVNVKKLVPKRKDSAGDGDGGGEYTG